MTRYVALLRGINVGGKNIIKMAALAACFEANGFRGVSTFIQSGNVLFDGDGAAAALARRLEAMLGDAFGYRASVVLRTRAQVAQVIDRAPAGFGDEPDRYRYDVFFLKAPLTAADALATVPVREGVDATHAGPGVLYATRLIRKAAQSRIARLTAMPIYQQMTIRNWATTTRLHALLRGA
ncbi:MAG TPA: DUF1697 domain-containing protein [Kofleriaceae bacterium]|nr:DUF1697 domain-containing protein [Kofleriaceae bacterium]